MPEFTFELRTRHLPTIRTDSDELTAPAGDEAAPWWASWLKPEVSIRHPFGTWTKAPYGSPGESTWPLLAIIGGAVLLAILTLAVVGASHVFRR